MFSYPYITRNMNNIPLLNTEDNFLKNAFFLSTIIEWTNLDPVLRTVTSSSTFKETINTTIFEFCLQLS